MKAKECPIRKSTAKARVFHIECLAYISPFSYTPTGTCLCLSAFKLGNSMQSYSQELVAVLRRL